MNKFNINIILIFIGKALGIFFLMYLLFSATGLEKKVLQTICKQQTYFHTSKTQSATFTLSNDYKEWDTRLVVYRSDIQPNGEQQFFSLKYLCYISILLFLSLLLATPIPLKRMLITLLLGLGLLFVYMYLICGVVINKLVYRIKDIAEVEYSSFWHFINEKLFEIFLVNGIEWIGLIPIALWLITAFRPSDYKN